MTIREQNNKPKNEISRKVFLALSSNVVVTLFGLISLFFIKRYMGYEALGIFAFAMAYVSLFKIFGDLGFSLAHTKRVSEGMELGKCHGTFFTIKIALTVFMGIVIFLFIISQNFFGSKMDSQLLENTIYLSILWVMIFNLNKGFRSAFTAKKEIAKNRIPRIFGRFIIMIMKVTIAVYGFSVLYLIGAEILGTLIILIIYIYLFRNEPVSKPTRKYIDKYRSFALPVMFLSISFTIMNNLNRVMIGLFVDTSGVGYYYLAQRLTEVFAILGVSIVMVVFPYVSEFASRSEFTKIRNLTSGIERHICLLLFPVMVAMFVLATPLLVQTFGSDSTNSVFVFRILLLSAALNILRQPYGLHIIATDNTSTSLRINVCALILNVILNIIFIPQTIFGIEMIGGGIVGASYATLFTLMFQYFLIKYYAKIYTGSSTSIRTVKISILSIILGLILMFYFNFNYLSIFNLGVAFISILFLFMFIFYIFGELTRKEVNFILRMVNPSKMKAYISQEFK